MTAIDVLERRTDWAVDIAYCAGIVDGEGCIRIKKSKAYGCTGRRTPGYHASIVVRMVEVEAIDILTKTIGGWWYSSKSSLKSGRPFHCWQLSDKKAEAALRMLLPYLRVKKRQAEIVLQLRDLQKTGRQHRTKITGYQQVNGYYGGPRTWAIKCFSDEYVAKCDDLFLACKRLNRVGKEAVST